MKKLLVLLAAAGLLFAFSSCDKTCKCKDYVAGVVVAEPEFTLDKDNTSLKKCSDLNTVVQGAEGKFKTGIECR